MTQTITDMFAFVGFTVCLVVAVFREVVSVLDSRQPVSADARRLRDALRKEAPLKGRVDRFPRGRGLTEAMWSEIGAAEGFRLQSRGRGRYYFEYVGRSGEGLPDA